MNLPNSITLARITCVPLFLWILSTSVFNGQHGRQELLAAAVFLLASVTDGVDGYLARRLHQVTTLGMLLSPLADKLLVATAFITLVRFAPTLVPAWIAVLIVGREFLVTALNSVAAQQHMRLKMRDLGKGKTALQTLCVLAILLAHAWPRWHAGHIMLPGAAIATGVLWVTMATSLTAAIASLRRFWMEALQQNRRKPLPFVVKRASDADRSAEL